MDSGFLPTFFFAKIFLTVRAFSRVTIALKCWRSQTLHTFGGEYELHMSKHPATSSHSVALHRRIALRPRVPRPTPRSFRVNGRPVPAFFSD